MKLVILLLYTVFFFGLYGQDTTNRHLQVSIGKNFNGTGAMQGVYFAADYEKRESKQLSFGLGFATTSDQGKEQYFLSQIPTSSGNIAVEGYYKPTTLGLQGIAYLSYSVVKYKQDELYVRLAPMLRYQTSSYFSAYPQGQSSQSFVGQSKSSQTFSFGGSGQIGYRRTTKKYYTVGFYASFQTDTNEDNLGQISFAIGRRF